MPIEYLLNPLASTLKETEIFQLYLFKSQFYERITLQVGREFLQSLPR